MGDVKSSFCWVGVDQSDGRIVVQHMERIGGRFVDFGAFALDRDAAKRLADKLVECAEGKSS